MIVELIGLPGAGKSTIARSLSDRETRRMVQVGGKGEILYYFLGLLIRHPIRVCWIVRQAWWQTKSLSALWNRAFVRLAKLRKAQMLDRGNITLILDEGPLQNFFSFAFSYDTPAKARQDIARLLFVNHVLHVQVAEEVRSKRLQDRKGFIDKDYSDQRHAQMRVNDRLLVETYLSEVTAVETIDDINQTLTM